MDLRAAKGFVIPFIGLAEVEFQLISDVQTSVFLTPLEVVRKDTSQSEKETV